MGLKQTQQRAVDSYINATVHYLNNRIDEVAPSFRAENLGISEDAMAKLDGMYNNARKDLAASRKNSPDIPLEHQVDAAFASSAADERKIKVKMQQAIIKDSSLVEELTEKYNNLPKKKQQELSASAERVA